MKPKDLFFPFIQNEKKVFLDIPNRIFYVPSRTSRPHMPREWREVFKGETFCHLEIGSGNGEWIIEKALKEPQKIWVALEMRFDRVRKIWSKMKNHQIENLWILCGEALDALNHYFPDQSLSQVSINFPDPWPKKRHAKNRLIQPPFLKVLSRVLKGEGGVDLLTDDTNYHIQMKEVFDAHPNFQGVLKVDDGFFDAKSYGSSYFMKLWEEKEKNFYFLKYKNHIQNRAELLT